MEQQFRADLLLRRFRQRRDLRHGAFKHVDHATSITYRYVLRPLHGDARSELRKKDIVRRLFGRLVERLNRRVRLNGLVEPIVGQPSMALYSHSLRSWGVQKNI
jgi:hypothetical protein